MYVEAVFATKPVVVHNCPPALTLPTDPQQEIPNHQLSNNTQTFRKGP